MAKKEEYHNLKDLQSDELNLEKVIEKIREEAKEEEIPERLKPEHLDEILNSQKKKGRWQGMKKTKIYGSSCMGGSFSRNWSFQRSTYS